MHIYVVCCVVGSNAGCTALPTAHRQPLMLSVVVRVGFFYRKRLLLGFGTWPSFFISFPRLQRFSRHVRLVSVSSSNARYLHVRSLVFLLPWCTRREQDARFRRDVESKLCLVFSKDEPEVILLCKGMPGTWCHMIPAANI